MLSSGNSWLTKFYLPNTSRRMIVGPQFSPNNLLRILKPLIFQIKNSPLKTSRANMFASICGHVSVPQYNYLPSWKNYNLYLKRKTSFWLTCLLRIKKTTGSKPYKTRKYKSGLIFTRDSINIFYRNVITVLPAWFNLFSLIPLERS